MIAYFDTSAFFPLIVAEPSSGSCRQLWNVADQVVSVRLLYVEATAALHQARRLHRIDIRSLRRCLSRLDQLWAEVDIIELDTKLMAAAAVVAGTDGLRGYDAVHCAAALSVVSEGDVAAAGDAHLLRAWQAHGVATYDIHATR